MLLEHQTTEQIIGAFFKVYRYFGFGFLESNYANAMEVELNRRGLRVAREVPVQVMYYGVAVGTYRFDMLVSGRVLVEVKAAERLSLTDERQLLNYLRATNMEVGLLLHFGPEPVFKRVVNSRRPVRDD
jgi:GxxExxY protein